MVSGHQSSQSRWPGGGYQLRAWQYGGKHLVGEESPSSSVFEPKCLRLRAAGRGYSAEPGQALHASVPFFVFYHAGDLTDKAVQQ